MTLGEQSGIVLALTVVLYGAAGIGFLFRGWPFRGGVVMFVISLLPLIWQIALTDSDAPGFGVLFIFMAPLPLLLMAVGTIIALVRALLRLRRRRVEQTEHS
jgi:hypothetical protein